MTSGRSAEPVAVSPARTHVIFSAGDIGEWRIARCQAVAGQELKRASRLHVARDSESPPSEAVWRLRGVTSYERYVNAQEQDKLSAVSPQLGRAAATSAALIPTRKSADWWILAADRRREILEESSHHIATGLRYLPAVARRLYHGRDLGEPFDFLTWFEYAPEDAGAFEELVVLLRATEEWRYVEREVDIRLTR